VRAALGQAVAGVVSAAVALADPAVIVLGGSWGAHPGVFEAVHEQISRLARPPILRPAAVSPDAALTGVRSRAVDELRHDVVHYRQRLAVPTPI
jgi:hypothetical protein